MGHFIHNAEVGKTAEWMMQSQWKLRQLQLKTWGSSTCVRYFPSVRSFELTSVRLVVCRRLGYCDGWKSKILHLNWNFTLRKSYRNSQCFAWSSLWADSEPQYSFPLGYSFSWRTCHHKRWRKARKAENINRWTKCETCGGISCARSSSDVRGNITSCRDFTKISIPHFDKIFVEKNCARWVPHCLTAEQKQKRLEIATLLKQRFNVEGQAFLYRIFAIDETWVRDYEPDLKSQSNEWRIPTSPLPKKFRRAQSKVKEMMIFAYDQRGTIMTEFHVEQVWEQRTIATGCKNCAEKCTKTDLTYSGMGHPFCTVMHVCTWERLWPIC